MIYALANAGGGIYAALPQRAYGRRRRAKPTLLGAAVASQQQRPRRLRALVARPRIAWSPRKRTPRPAARRRVGSRRSSERAPPGGSDDGSGSTRAMRAGWSRWAR